MNAYQTSEPSPPEVHTETSWPEMVERIRRGDPTGLEDLYRVFAKGVRFLIFRKLGPKDLDDKVHDVFLVVAQSIQRGDLREPERLMGYVNTVVRRQVAAHIEDAIQARRCYTDLDGTLLLSDRRPDPERTVIEKQNDDLAWRILNSIGKRDREVLVRFYLDEQTPEDICREMQLTETQFRLIKSRAKARFGEMGKRRFSLRHGFRQ